MTRVEVSPVILKWAANRAGKSESIHLDFPQWVQWINNERKLTFKQLEELSKKTSTPLGYFFLKEPPVERLPIPHFRTIDNPNRVGPSPNLLETVQTMERRQAWMREYLIENENDPLPFVAKGKAVPHPIEIANDMRQELGLKNDWAAGFRTWQDALRLLFQKIEDAGILVVVNSIVGNNSHRKLDVNEFRGFVLVDNYAPLIFVNGSDGKAAQMFTLAHELAHIWYGASAAFDLQNLQPADNEIEWKCNLIAAEFLVPESELRKFWASVHLEHEPFQQIARRFKVSEIVAARRIYDLGLITKNKFFEFYQKRYIVELQESQVDDHNGGGNFYATQKFRISRRFAEAVIRATFEGKLLYNEAYRLTGLKSETFSKFAKYLGFEGEQ